METLTLVAEGVFAPEQMLHVATHRFGPHGKKDHFQPHTHSGFMEFFYVIEGRLWHRYNDEERDVAAGDLVFIREHDTHWHGLHPKCKTHATILNIAFQSHLVQRSLMYLDRESLLPLFRNRGVAWVLKRTGSSRKRFEDLLRESCAEFPRRDLALRGLLNDVLVQIIRSFVPYIDPLQKKGGASIPVWLQELCATLETPKGFLLRASELPRLVHKTPEHFSRAFKTFLGKTPTDYLNARRLDYAAHLLSTTDEKILNIAYDCRFDQPGYFYRLFKRRFGITPKEHRRIARNLIAP